MATAKKSGFSALGRRKQSTARVRLQSGKGSISINGKEAKDYLGSSQNLLDKLVKPFAVIGVENKFDISAKVDGGGHSAQVEAITLGISKALIEVNPDYKDTLKRSGLLRRDSRDKERKKFGLRGARKKQQFSKR